MADEQIFVAMATAAAVYLSGRARAERYVLANWCSTKATKSLRGRGWENNVGYLKLETDLTDLKQSVGFARAMKLVYCGTVHMSVTWTRSKYTMGVAEKEAGLISYRWSWLDEWAAACGKEGAVTIYSTPPPGYYLVGTLPDEGGEFGHHQVHTFQAGLFQFADLFFQYSLKSKVRGEQPRSEGRQICGSLSGLKEDRKEKGKGGRIKREKSFSWLIIAYLWTDTNEVQKGQPRVFTSSWMMYHLTVINTA